ncbi:MAG: CRISPR-associated endonuclease Cas1 [Porticoccaceae bacterium]
MTTLYLDRRDLAVELASGRLRVRHPDGRVQDVPLALLERVVITATTRLDSSLLARLGAAGVAVMILNPRSADRVAFLLGAPHNDLGVRLGQYRLLDHPEWVGTWSQRLVRAKLVGQRRLLRNAMALRPEARLPLHKGIQALDAALAHCAQTAAPATLRGIEGAAAAAYFGALAAVLPAALDFGGRNRRPPRDPVNALLSLTYTLLHFDAVRAAYAVGLDPYLGFYHRPAFSRESLASDLLEILRPSADRFVWRLLAEATLRADHFSRQGDACLLGKAGRGHFYAAYEPFAAQPRRLLRRLCRMLARKMRESAPDLADD